MSSEKEWNIVVTFGEADSDWPCHYMVALYNDDESDPVQWLSIDTDDDGSQPGIRAEDRMRIMGAVVELARDAGITVSDIGNYTYDL